MPIPELSTPVIVAAGGAVTLLGYSGQTAWINRRSRKREAGGGTGVERRQGRRATAGGRSAPAELAAQLAAAIDVMVTYIDGAETPSRAQAAARQVALVIPEENRGDLLNYFFQQVSLGTPDTVGSAAEAACLQMAIELRALLARAEAEREFASPPREVPPAEPPPLAAAPRRPSRARPRFVAAEEEVHQLATKPAAKPATKAAAKPAARAARGSATGSAARSPTKPARGDTVKPAAGPAAKPRSARSRRP